MAPCSWLILLALSALNPDLGRAVDLMDELKYPEAARVLEAARKRPGNDRATLLQILELQGVVASTLDQAERARGFYRALVSIDPDYKLSRDYAPRVVTPFLEAKSWISRRGALQLQADPAPARGPISAVGVKVPSDPVKLAKEVRFHWRADGGPWRTEQVPLAAGRASAPVAAQRLEWWAELLGEAQAVLAQEGSEQRPVAWGAPRLELPPPPRTETAKPLPPRVPAAALAEAPVPAPVSWGLIALGGASAGVAGYFGWRSSDARARIAAAEVGADGLTRGLTQKDAYALDAQARQDAVVANVLFGAGAAVAAGGAIMLVAFGHPVEVGARPGGLTLESPIP
ncbi:MAG TPA: hypothetical protein VND93_00785 [Myxococcales bacterium]|nr:hypothetical protein [Myxococcales bacterium]